MWAALQRRRIAIGAALLDQSVVAGIGNVFRAEALFLAGVHPDRPARDVTRGEFEALWRILRVQLRAGERSGRIVTVIPAEVGAPNRANVPDAERVYVYRRTGQPCRRCGTPVTSWPLGGRSISACPACQPR
jgi:endonuclease VIII